MAVSDKEPLLFDPPAYKRSNSMSSMSPNAILKSFVLMSICFSANHGAVTACLGLSSVTTDLTFLGADLGTYQSGCLYLFYTASAVFGGECTKIRSPNSATTLTHNTNHHHHHHHHYHPPRVAAYIVKKVGPRNGLLYGLIIYCVYVACFLVAAVIPDSHDAWKWPVALLGAAIGGVGGGFLWTAQGAYFGKTAEAYAIAKNIPTSEATSSLGGIFAFFYLAEEVMLKMLSTLLTKVFDYDWTVVFAFYTAIAVSGAIGMGFCHSFRVEDDEESKPLCTKLFSAVRILVNDSKMKYMIPMNAVFGFSAAFLTSYVTGQVVHLQKNGDDYAGALTAIPAGVAAIFSIIFGQVAKVTGKGPVLITGACTFGLMTSLFVVNPDTASWGWTSIFVIYSLMGVGRATFEGTLRATFADFFANDKEGAFANIILQSGLSSALGFLGFPHILCKEESDYCVRYKDDTLHNVLAMEIICIGTAVLAVVGYSIAAVQHKQQKKREENAFGPPSGKLVESV